MEVLLSESEVGVKDFRREIIEGADWWIVIRVTSKTMLLHVQIMAHTNTNDSQRTYQEDVGMPPVKANPLTQAIDDKVESQ